MKSQSVFVKSWKNCQNRLISHNVSARLIIVHSLQSACVCLCMFHSSLFIFLYFRLYFCHIDLVSELNLMMMMMKVSK